MNLAEGRYIVAYVALNVDGSWSLDVPQALDDAPIEMKVVMIGRGDLKDTMSYLGGTLSALRPRLQAEIAGHELARKQKAEETAPGIAPDFGNVPQGDGDND